MTNQVQQNVANTVQQLDMFTWRLNRMSAEKHQAEVNRGLLRRQH